MAQPLHIRRLRLNRSVTLLRTDVPYGDMVFKNQRIMLQGTSPEPCSQS